MGYIVPGYYPWDSVDGYVQRNKYHRLLAEQQNIEGANRYPLSAAIKSFKNYDSIPIASKRIFVGLLLE